MNKAVEFCKYIKRNYPSVGGISRCKSHIEVTCENQLIDKLSQEISI